MRTMACKKATISRGCRFREDLTEELHLLRLLIHFRIDPEIAHIRIPAVEAVVHYGVRIIRELQLGTFPAVKGVSLPVPVL